MGHDHKAKRKRERAAVQQQNKNLAAVIQSVRDELMGKSKADQAISLALDRGAAPREIGEAIRKGLGLI